MYRTIRSIEPRMTLRSPAGAAVLLSLIIGCGGPDLNTGSRSGSFDQGLSGNFNGFGQSSGRGGSGPGARVRGVFARFETSFELPDIQGNPFDYTENDVVVSITAPDNRVVRVPAFFDGDKTWRMRYSPDQSGRHQISKIQVNGRDAQPQKVERRDFDVTGSPEAGFVRRDQRDRSRLVFDNGNSYYPLGQNVAFTTSVVTPAEKPPPAPVKSEEKSAAAAPGPSGSINALASNNAPPPSSPVSTTVSAAPAGIPAVLEKMGRSGLNWSRIWMTHWDGKSLDWPPTGKAITGRFDLDAARRWDAIVDAAEKSGVRFQMVLQHHGQWSTRVDPNWDANPWNKKNGGFLATPDEFFSNPRAIALTRAKYRYILARWGYSPSILSWELFNEVESTDAVYHKHQDEVAAWHNAMTIFLRQQDPYRHMVTSSSTSDRAALGKELDYAQPHAYVWEPISAVAEIDTKALDRPIFFGEVGPQGRVKSSRDFLHKSVWAGLMSEASGAPGWWEWQTAESDGSYDSFRSAGDFLRQSGTLSKRGLKSAPVSIETAEMGDLALHPGGGWSAARQTEFTVLPSGIVSGIGAMPSFLQGDSSRSLFPSATFKANFPAAGTVKVELDRVSRQGAKVVVSVDGVASAELALPAGSERSVSETLEAKVIAGTRTIKLENTGADWVRLKSITLTPCGPALGAVAKSSRDFASIWVYNRGARGEGKGKLSVAGMQAGNYKVTWWDTRSGKVLSEETAASAGSGIVLSTPAVTEDIACWIVRANDRAASKEKPRKSKATK